MGAQHQLTQTQIRNLIIAESTMNNMLSIECTIKQPAYEYIPEESIAEAIAFQQKKLEKSGKHIPIRYHNRN